MDMCDCPNWSSCNAPICPLDTRILQRTYLRGEAICFYMHEFVKPDSYERFKECHRVEIHKAIANIIEEVLSTYGYIKKRLERASSTPSRMVFISAEEKVEAII